MMTVRDIVIWLEKTTGGELTPMNLVAKPINPKMPGLYVDVFANVAAFQLRRHDDQWIIVPLARIGWIELGPERERVPEP
jgi:hypothetical protein